ncbi:MAG: hypothetical protein RL285_1504 [Bacteroidota bacterium]
MSLEPLQQPQFEERITMTKIGLITLIPATALMLIITLHDLRTTGIDLAIDLFKQPQLWIMLSVLILLLSLKLKVQINGNEIRYQMLPFHRKARCISWQDVTSCQILKINALREFGGWGIRSGRLGKAYNPEGNIILHIETRTGTPINVSIRNHELLSAMAAKQGWNILPLVKKS